MLSLQICNKPVVESTLLNQVLAVLFQSLKLDDHVVGHRARLAATVKYKIQQQKYKIKVSFRHKMEAIEQERSGP